MIYVTPRTTGTNFILNGIFSAIKKQSAIGVLAFVFRGYNKTFHRIFYLQRTKIALALNIDLFETVFKIQQSCIIINLQLNLRCCINEADTRWLWHVGLIKLFRLHYNLQDNCIVLLVEIGGGNPQPCTFSLVSFAIHANALIFVSMFEFPCRRNPISALMDPNGIMKI